MSNSSVSFECNRGLVIGSAFTVDKKTEAVSVDMNPLTQLKYRRKHARRGRTGPSKSGQIAKPNSCLAQTPASAINTASSDRKIIRNAELNLEADDPEDVPATNHGDRRDERRIRRRIPAKQQRHTSDYPRHCDDECPRPFRQIRETLDEIRKTANRVVVETVKGQDVTEEFVDIEAQLKAKKALEEQFMSIMKRANSVDDALSVQSQLAEVRGEIERIEGRKRFLENQSSLSTIKIRLQTAKVFAASSAGLGARLTDAFSSGFDVAMNFFLGS